MNLRNLANHFLFGRCVLAASKGRRLKKTSVSLNRAIVVLGAFALLTATHSIDTPLAFAESHKGDKANGNQVASETNSETIAEKISFDQEIRPLLANHCLACHGGVKQAGGLSMVWKDSLLGESDSGEAIIPGNADDSELIYRVTEEDEDVRMPPPEHGAALNPSEIETLRNWINQGASWELPWAFVPPKQSSIPQADTNSNWPRNTIDRFVLHRIHENQLTPSQESAPTTWLRRVSFDLIGLPPSKAHMEAFLADLADEDQKPTAYERAVERLLDSPHFGERWASIWLDLARYADTSGYERDPHRNMWPYRDWVIQAFDDDKPYNEFLVEQMAGDLLPQATIKDRIATAFHRNTPTNKEGGTDDEEFRIAAVVDRVDTTWQATQGISFACAKCHDHPYDPLSQQNYYEFYAGFNSTQDVDLLEDFPKLSVPHDRKKWAQAEAIDNELAATNAKIHASGLHLAQDKSQWQGLAFDKAISTGLTELRIEPVKTSVNGSSDRGTEVLAEGTINARSIYTLEASAIEGELTAIRIDALPYDIAEALKNAEYGFVLSRLRMFVDRADGSKEELFFSLAFCDDSLPFFSPEESLNDSAEGWSSYSRLIRPRWAVFVLDQQAQTPLTLAKEDRLRFTFKHSKTLDGQGAMVIHRLRLATTDNARWDTLSRDPTLASLQTQVVQLQEERRRIKGTTMPVLVELPKNHERASHLFVRGNFLVAGKRLYPNVPELTGSSVPLTSMDSSEMDRLDIANWITSEVNPFTSRVWVNRVWHELFGQGLVRSLDDFGTSGEKPSHPKLLDHLAIEFTKQHGWKLKSLLREIVLSATYRQDSKQTEAARSSDPTNQWISHGPRKRLNAEMIRDQALVLSGQFNPKKFGKSVMPYQPEGVWRSVFNNRKWVTSEGAERFRRAVYTYWKRTAAYPSLRTFDAPSRELCTAQRPTTNTPLQALALLNDPAYQELANEFAKRMLSHGDLSLEEQIAWGYKQATTQQADENAVTELTHLYHEAMKEFSLQESTTDVSERAMRIVASAIMNLDETLNY